MPILPDDYIDPDFHELVDGSSMTEIVKSFRATPELIIDEDPLAELPFEKVQHRLCNEKRN
jgi:hypothetical protein